MAVKVAINGFGRIGRKVLRAIVEAGRKDIEVVAINDLGPVETNAHLLRYDSVHGRFPGKVTVEGDTIDVGIGPIKVTADRDPPSCRTRRSASTSRWSAPASSPTRDKAAAHLEAGAKRVHRVGPGRRRRPDRRLRRQPREADARITWSSPTPRARPTAWRRWPRC